MNSNSTQRWLLRAALPLAFLTAAKVALLAQIPCDITWPNSPNPVPITIVINAFNGTATLNYAVVQSNGVTSGICGPLTSDDYVRFYTSAAKTAFFQPLNPSKVELNCTHVGSPVTVWVAINDGSHGDMSMNPPSESDAVPLLITLVDNTLPTLITSPPPATLNTSDDGLGDCSVTDVFVSSVGVHDIALTGDLPGFCVGLGGCFEDNCLLALTVTYELSGATVQAETPAPLVSSPPPVWDAGLATFKAGVTTVTYRVYDDNIPLGPNNPLVVTTTVTVNDDENPTITCPPNQSFFTNPGVCTRLVTNLAATYSDNCEVTTVTWTAPGATPAASPLTGINDTLTATFPLGSTIVTFQASDAAGNAVNCMFTVNVTDNEPPTVTCPPSKTIAASAPPACNYTAGTELDGTRRYSRRFSVDGH